MGSFAHLIPDANAAHRADSSTNVLGARSSEAMSHAAAQTMGALSDASRSLASMFKTFGSSGGGGGAGGSDHHHTVGLSGGVPSVSAGGLSSTAPASGRRRDSVPTQREGPAPMSMSSFSTAASAVEQPTSSLASFASAAAPPPSSSAAGGPRPPAHPAALSMAGGGGGHHGPSSPATPTFNMSSFTTAAAPSSAGGHEEGPGEGHHPDSNTSIGRRSGGGGGAGAGSGGSGDIGRAARWLKSTVAKAVEGGKK